MGLALYREMGAGFESYSGIRVFPSLICLFAPLFSLCFQIFRDFPANWLDFAFAYWVLFSDFLSPLMNLGLGYEILGILF